MTGLEISLLVLGTLFVIISFFIVGDKPQESGEGDVSRRQPRTLTGEEEQQIKDNIANIVEEQTDKLLSETDAKLDKLTNEKIIAVTEYSDQVLEKINSNHQEVVFLYEMLQKKEEELKSALNSLNSSRIEYEKLYGKMRQLAEEEEKREAERIRDAAAALPNTRTAAPPVRTEPAVQKARPAAGTAAGRTAKASAGTAEQAARARSTAAARPPVRKEAPDRRVEALPKEVIPVAGRTEAIRQGGMSKNDKILALHKKNKSVVEISKLLGIGQGEVKLVIDLYGD